MTRIIATLRRVEHDDLGAIALGLMVLIPLLFGFNVATLLVALAMFACGVTSIVMTHREGRSSHKDIRHG
ncbi:hypothetical protein [Sphingomonas baiyangensis]|uniref:Uncharacterized protein n=1 Tax=Sphingomonas baiyangensis TaxID=2572576 RepID=A0A4U1L0Q9_9SPHN|nr:hypothetical protein [Sphingomonas baiyangensis]TKD50192.1 hypothetical protein FBR43_05060 [Sphingomonas baiyangensis]